MHIWPMKNSKDNPYIPDCQLKFPIHLIVCMSVEFSREIMNGDEKISRTIREVYSFNDIEFTAIPEE